MEHTETNPQRQARLAYFNEGERVFAEDQSQIAFCISAKAAERIASALRATEAIVDPEAAIHAARMTLELVADEPRLTETYLQQEARKALAALGGRPV